MSSLHKSLKTYFGYNNFRPLQEQIITSCIEGNDTLALLPTGGGKSICYQLPALLMNGICIVISPLIALMKDQVMGLNKRGINAETLHSGLTYQQSEAIISRLSTNRIKFLFVSPEKLSTTNFIKTLKYNANNICLIAIDEAHCVSEWGYDFRPSYLKINKLRDEYPNVPFIALTATATPKVQKDIPDKLGFRKNFNVFTGTFARNNLRLVVRETPTKIQDLLLYLSKLSGSGLIYCGTRKNTQLVADALLKKNYKAAYYHAGLTSDIRNRLQEDWINNKIEVMACTNAFGMGIDKPDVRYVIHYDIPNNPEAYYQEAGRAGRDGKLSTAILMRSEADAVELNRKLNQSFPTVEYIKNAYTVLMNEAKIHVNMGEGIEFELDIALFCKEQTLNTTEFYNALKFLEKSGYLLMNEGFYRRGRIKITCSNADFIDFKDHRLEFDSLLDALARKFPGIFTEYVNYSTKELCFFTHLQENELYGQLNYLQKVGLLAYERESSLPLIKLTSPRVDIKHLDIAPEAYLIRKKEAEQRLEFMINYANAYSNTCRMQRITQYFGETTVPRCGMCDVCRKTNPKDGVEKYVLDFIKNNKISISEIINTPSSYKKDVLLQAIRNLIDSKVLIWHRDNYISRG